MKENFKKYLYGRSALEYWDVPDIRGVLEDENEEFPKEFVIFTDKNISRSSDLWMHTCKIVGAEKYVKNGACTLPLVFLQMANKYNIYELIFLGIQICSFRENRLPLCSVKDLKKCAEELKKHRGRRKALRALQYIKNGSRSPMETMLFMFLSLPNSLGGCSMPGIIFNKKIVMKDFKKMYFADLYFSSKKLVVEYDSYQHHDNKKSFSRDNIRAAELEAEGYELVSVKTAQLQEVSHFETLAKNIAKRIGYSLRVRTNKFIKGFIGLRDLLFHARKHIHGRLRKIEISELPDFYGVPYVYKLYLQKFEKLKRFIDSNLRFPIQLFASS